MSERKDNDIRDAVRKNYRGVAQSASATSSCCSPSCCSEDDGATSGDISIVLGYSIEELSKAPQASNLGLGCGNPLAIASLKPGETVLDLGSGGGFDAFLAAQAVGESGRVIGVDMTPEMVERARRLASENGFSNVEFHLAEIENLPMAPCSVDVIISNCVINLSPQKARVLEEAFRVLRPGGRLAVSDVVATTELPAEVKNDLSLHSRCISGASPINALRNALKQTGFVDVDIRPKDESATFIREWAPDLNPAQFIVSAIIEAVKPS